MRNAFLHRVIDGDVVGRDGFDAPMIAQPQPPGACFDEAAFAFPRDELSCDGEQRGRFDATQGLFVGVVTCDAPDEVRVYLSRAAEGPFLPATDTGGHGQDHCSLLAPGFPLPNEDDITSGGCIDCGTSRSLPLEGVSAWARASIGESFELVPVTPTWSHQTSRLRCGVDVTECADDAPPAPPVEEEAEDDHEEEDALPPAGDTPCGPGKTVALRFDIDAAAMEFGTGDLNGPGVCYGEVTFTADLHDVVETNLPIYHDDGTSETVEVEYNGWTEGCDAPHCGALLDGAGEVSAQHCTVFAFCDAETGMARAVGFTW